MDTSVDFLTENLLCTFDSQDRDLLTQLFTDFNHLLLGFHLGSSDDLVTFFIGTCFGIFNDGQGTSFSVSQTVGRFSTGLAQFKLNTAIGRGEFGFGFVRSGEAVGPAVASWIGDAAQCLLLHPAMPAGGAMVPASANSIGVATTIALFAFNAYSEGWGLYAEQLAAELGVYDAEPLGRAGERARVDHREERTQEDGVEHSVLRSRRLFGNPMGVIGSIR